MNPARRGDGGVQRGGNHHAADGGDDRHGGGSGGAQFTDDEFSFEFDPGDEDFAFVQCSFCNPDGLGYGALRRAWEAKSGQPELSRLTALLLHNEVTDA